MFQEILTYIIILGAVAYTLYSFIRTFTKKAEKSCGGGCSCGTKSEIKNVLGEKYKLLNR